jgi:energy-coupling factor transporter ATP-binding protein EcfA2
MELSSIFLPYFGPNDAALFSGRDTAIERLTAAVTQQSFTALVGASGSGKSSVVLAGLAPRLHGMGGSRFSHFRLSSELEHNAFMALARALVPLFMASADDGRLLFLYPARAHSAALAAVGRARRTSAFRGWMDWAVCACGLFGTGLHLAEPSRSGGFFAVPG